MLKFLLLYVFSHSLFKDTANIEITNKKFDSLIFNVIEQLPSSMEGNYKFLTINIWQFSPGKYTFGFGKYKPGDCKNLLGMAMRDGYEIFFFSKCDVTKFITITNKYQCDEKEFDPDSIKIIDLPFEQNYIFENDKFELSKEISLDGSSVSICQLN